MQKERDKGVPMAVEFLGGLFGFMGIGWMISGHFGAGVALLFGWWIWVAIAIAAIVLTGGLAACIQVPLEFIMPLLSAIWLGRTIDRENLEIRLLRMEK
jgi:hypothetical protein